MFAGQAGVLFLLICIFSTRLVGAKGPFEHKGQQFEERGVNCSSGGEPFIGTARIGGAVINYQVS